MTGKTDALVTISVVSHGQEELVTNLLGDLASCSQFSVILTHNLSGAVISIPDSLEARIQVIRNATPKGFGANHNAAFRHCTTPYFCVLNPDIRLSEDPFPKLLACLLDSHVALVAPAVLNTRGEIEDSSRDFPTIWGLLLKAMGGTDGRLKYSLNDPPQRPDWVAGMFLLLRSEAFRSLDGFDEGFHLYYEDVDLCARLRKKGHDLLLCPAVRVVHDARRTSHRDLRYLVWHFSSMSRYFIKHLGRLPNKKGIDGISGSSRESV